MTIPPIPAAGRLGQFAFGAVLGFVYGFFFWGVQRPSVGAGVFYGLLGGVLAAIFGDRLWSRLSEWCDRIWWWVLILAAAGMLALATYYS